LDPKHASAAIVALCLVVLALADGGSEVIALSIGSALVWAAILVGIAAGWLPRSRPGSLAIAAGGCLAAVALITGLSAIWASDPGSAFDEAVVALAYAGVFVLVLLAAVPGSATTWLAGLAVGLVGVAVLALGARLEPSLFGDGEADLIGVLPAAEGRLSDPFLYWNALAGAMAAAVTLLAWFGATAASRGWRTAAIASIPPVALALYLATSRGGVAIAAIGLAVLLLAGRDRLRLLATVALGAAGSAVLILFAASREELVDHPLAPAARDQVAGLELALLAVVAVVAIAAYAAVPAIARLRDPQVRLRRAHWIATGVAGALLVAGLVVAADPVERWEEFKEPPDVPAAGEARDLFARGGSSGRYQFWSTAVDAFEEDPLKGVGASGYEYYWNAHGSLPQPGPNGHSLVLDTAGELGIIGVAAVLGFAGLVLVGGAGRVVAQRESAAGAAPAALAVATAGLAQAAVDWTWENPACFAVTVVAAALVLGPATAAASASEAGGERRGRRRFAGGVLVLGFSWIAICASALLLLTSLSLSSSRGAFGDGDLERAADAADDAIDLQPWAAEPRQQLALVLEAEGDLPAARDEIDEAIERSPEDWRLWLVAARMALEADDPVSARSHAELAQSLAPRLTPLDRPVDEILDGLL
jgi:tetratricopeptide (TPR) repeat protein